MLQMRVRWEKMGEKALWKMEDPKEQRSVTDHLRMLLCSSYSPKSIRSH